jgi:succinate dehydrogenase / fumarate reductase cytochrome b subunit
MPEMTRQRPGTMRLVDALQYRLPLAGVVSILHRLSGLIMLALLPLLVWLFDTSVSSEASFDVFKAAFTAGIGFVPGWLVKVVVWALIWSYLHHFIAGLRHLWMDVAHAVTKEFGLQSAVGTLGLSITLTLLLGAKLFGLF